MFFNLAANIDSDPTAEISHFQIRLSSLAIIIVHEDLLFRATDGDDHILSLPSVQQMQQASKDFFTKLRSYVPHAFGNKDFEISGSIFDEACNLNHIR